MRQSPKPVAKPAVSDRSPLHRRLAGALRGEVFCDRPSRARYANDASAYQMMPAAVVVAAHAKDVATVLEIAAEVGLPVTARGAGTSQAGQAINCGIIVDTTKYMDSVVSVDAGTRTCVVEPGVVLDQLNRALAPTGLWFPVDISTASRATLGGMAGNNACGMRSLRYGTMRDNVLAIDGLLADGTRMRFGETDGQGASPLTEGLLAIGTGLADEVEKRFPKVLRRVGGYNLDALTPVSGPNNLSHLLVGSEGTLAFSSAITLRLAPQLTERTVGICHFGSFHAAMDAAQHLVTLKPVSLELIDRTMIVLGRDIAIYRDALNDMIRGDPAAVLVAEFADDADSNSRNLEFLTQMMGDLGFEWDRPQARWGGVVPVADAVRQNALTEVRKSGLNIMMSMKAAGKPVSFVEDCAVPLEHLAAYTDRLTEVFARHGTTGTWYAHASVGCLHVRPVLNLKNDKDLKAMRAIAEEAFALVRAFKGSHSGEHGDGIVRSEFHQEMFGTRIVAGFGAVKEFLDPGGLLNPGKIVRPPKMDDRALLRYGPDYQPDDFEPVLDWRAFGDAAGGLLGAAEMCNNNGACRKLDGGVMCPSFRATGDEQHLVRGRANSLRMALSGQLDSAGLASDAMADALRLCVSCKACRRECPTGVDMARMKTEFLSARAKVRGLSLRDWLISEIPRSAPLAARLSWVTTLRDRIPGAANLSERLFGFAARRPLPRFTTRPFAAIQPDRGPANGPVVALFADTFNSWFEPEILQDAVSALTALGYRVQIPRPIEEPSRGLCCGRTYLSAGRVDRARGELRRSLKTLAPLARQGVPILGLEPSCLLTLRDELRDLLPGEKAEQVAAGSYLLEEFLELHGGDALERLATHGLLEGRVHLHGHCHQKSFDVLRHTKTLLSRIPGLQVDDIASGCCGMAGAFGYQAETYEMSIAMAELDLLPAVRKIAPEHLIAAGGTSCRTQIRDTTGRQPDHPVSLLARALWAIPQD